MTSLLRREKGSGAKNRSGRGRDHHGGYTLLNILEVSMGMIKGDFSRRKRKFPEKRRTIQAFSWEGRVTERDLSGLDISWSLGGGGEERRRKGEYQPGRNL